MIHATYVFSEKEAASGLRQLGLKFLADSNSSNVNGKTHNCEADAQEHWAPTMGVTRLDSALCKKQVWRPYVRTWALSESKCTVLKKYLWLC